MIPPIPLVVLLPRQKANRRSALVSTTPFRRSVDFLPDLNAVRRGEVKLVSALDFKRRIPGIDVPHRICAEPRGRVWIRQHLLPERRFARLRSPILSEGDEELLFTGETFLCRG